MDESKQGGSGSPRVLGFPSLVALIVGIAISQVGLVGVLQGIAQLAGEPPWLIGGAFLTALLLAMTYASTFAELALMMPKAGGLSTYAEAAIGHFPALLATYSGYVVVNIFGLSAELILFDNIVREVLGLDVAENVISLGLLGLLAWLNVRGTDVFVVLQNSSTAVKVLLMIATGIACVFTAQGQVAISAVPESFEISFSASIALFFWCFVAAEFVCPMIEETRAPERNIPRAMFLGIASLAGLYALYAAGAMMLVDPRLLKESPFPHLEYAKIVFGKAGGGLLLVFATMATIGLINGVLAGVSRMLCGMARNGQAFPGLGKTHSRHGTPWVATLFMAIACGLPVIILGSRPDAVMLLVISASTCWLLAYIVAHAVLMVLRWRHPTALRPYRSPFFPVPQVIGILGMACVIVTNPADVLVATGALLGLVGILSAIWVRAVMKRGLFDPEPGHFPETGEGISPDGMSQ